MRVRGQGVMPVSRIWQRLARGLYATLLRAALPLYVFRLWRRGAREPLYRHALAERFGVYDQPAPPPGLLWLHAVSLGETRAAQPLIEALREQQPGLRLLLTHGTATGRHAGSSMLRTGDVQAWLPYDTPGAARRFLKHFKPTLGILMETELWPTLMREAERARVPMVLANARLSERSARKGRRLAALLHPAARRLSLALAQTDDDARRLREAGTRQVLIEGNLKFDLTPAAELLQRGRAWRQALGRPVVMAANTREGEEASLLASWRALPGPRPLLLIVPRHPQRFDAVADLVAAHNLSLLRRSQWADAPGPMLLEQLRQADVCLGDSMGEMPVYYASADVALLGGSFEPLGGHNLIEAAASGCPLVMGPHTFNFAQAADQALAAGAALRVPDMAAGVQLAVKTTLDPHRAEWAERALSFAAAHRGAAAQMARRILALAPDLP